MNEMLVIGAIIASLWLAILILRVPASIAFLSLLIGQLLTSQASVEVFNFVSGVVSINDVSIIEATLLMLPLLLTIIILRGRIASSKLLIEAVPALFVAALAVFLLSGYVSWLQENLEIATSNNAAAYQAIIASGASISGLLSAWFSYPKLASGKKSKNK